MSNLFGLDLGCANLIASAAEEGIVLREPSVIAIHKRTGSVLAVGSDVSSPQITKALGNAALTRPFRNGILSDCDIAYHVIASTLKHAFGKRLHGSRLIVSVPCNIDDVNESALIEIALRTGIKTCHTVFSPIAAMAGAFISPYTDCIMVDMGAVRTNIMIICAGKMIYRQTVEAGGEQFDKAIVDYMFSKYKVHISLRCAEELKLHIGTVWNIQSKKSYDVKAKSLENNKIININVSSDEMLSAFETPMASILEAVCLAVSKIPLENVNTVLYNGIILCGGASMLEGMVEMIKGITGVKTTLVEKPQDSVAVGLARIQEWLPPEIPSSLRNISRYYIENFIVNS